MTSVPHAPHGAGVGLRLPHLAEVVASRPHVPWLEIHPENFLANPHATELLLMLCRRYPISVHTVGLSIGSAGGIDRLHLKRVRALMDMIDPVLVSGHLAWSTHEGEYLNDLLPLPYDEDSLRVLAAHIDEVQDGLGRPYIVENPSSYIGFGASTMNEVEFLSELVRRTGCRLLCDVSNMLGKFPATVWLVGTPLLDAAARQFVRRYPPRAPCIAEYGEGFPHFLSAHPGAERLPYLRGFTELEWQIGQVAITVDRPALTLEELSTIKTDALTDATLITQTGIRYFNASWPVDELINCYLTEAAPDQYPLAPADIRIEVRGARGQFRINRLDAAEFTFRQAIMDGRSIGDAAECALDANAAFDPGRSLVTLVAEGLVTAFAHSSGSKP